MNITPINNQPNFQAKFVKNQSIMNFTKQEIQNGNEEEYINALKNLSQKHSNVSLLLSKKEHGYAVTNLYNKRTLHFNNFTSDTIDSLSNIKSSNYKQLFASDKIITPKKTEAITSIIADKYFVKSAPDYTIGHKIDASF